MKVVPQLMILDDNDMMQKFLKGYFNKKYDIVCLDHAAKAWNWLDQGNRPDLILADIVMPDISGIEFLEQLKVNTSTKDIPVIMLSGVDKSSQRIRCLELGAADYILKPFNPKELELRVNKYLNMSALS